MKRKEIANSQDEQLPKIDKIKKKKVTTEKEDRKKRRGNDIIVVPWSSTAEWDYTCKLFVEEDFKNMMERLLIWANRGHHGLPVGVEGTLFLLQALSFDSQTDSEQVGKDVQARSLYSLALLRFINHVSHLAASVIGGSTLPIFKLASQVDIPSWLVDLRHEISHGVNIPSLEILRLSATFIKNWLKENYWIPTGSSAENSNNILSGSVLQTETQRSENCEVANSDIEVNATFSTLSEITSAYIASRVYHLRHCFEIRDTKILKFWPKKKRITTKEALKYLKHELSNSLSHQAPLTCAVLAEEMIPRPDFYAEFRQLFSENTEIVFQGLWKPILKMVQRKGNLIELIDKLMEIHMGEDLSEKRQEMSGIWLKVILSMIENDESKDYTQELNLIILPKAMKSPNLFSQLFLSRLFRLVKRYLGKSQVNKLKTLSRIWTEPLDHEMKIKPAESSNFFKVEDIPLPTLSNSSVGIKKGPEYWGKIPLGAWIGQVPTEIHPWANQSELEDISMIDVNNRNDLDEPEK